MTQGKTWMHRAFPTLSPAEAEDSVNGLYTYQSDQLETMIKVAEDLARLKDVETSAAFEVMDTEEVYRRFVYGAEPIPDLATAEFIRRELQQRLEQWTREFTSIQSAAVRNAIGMKSSHKLPNEKRWLLWHLSGHDLDMTPKELCERLSAKLWLCERFGFPAGERDWADRIDDIREIRKQMRRSVEAGDRPYNLTSVEEDALETWVSLEPLPDDSM
jgi:hypothetical protein